jgi:hypothetical protein
MSKIAIKSFGVIVENLEDINLISQLNNLVDYTSLYCPIVFTNDMTLKTNLVPKFGRMQINHALGFKHPLISTNIYTTQILNTCFSTKHKYFAFKSLEWNNSKIQNFTYSFLSQIYNNPNIELISLDNQLTQTISNLWKTPVATLENWNYQDIITLLEQIYETD